MLPAYVEKFAAFESMYDGGQKDGSTGCNATVMYSLNLLHNDRVDHECKWEKTRMVKRAASHNLAEVEAVKLSRSGQPTLPHTSNA